jgi:hypothetical protein
VRPEAFRRGSSYLVIRRCGTIARARGLAMDCATSGRRPNAHCTFSLGIFTQMRRMTSSAKTSKTSAPRKLRGLREGMHQLWSSMNRTAAAFRCGGRAGRECCPKLDGDSVKAATRMLSRTATCSLGLEVWRRDARRHHSEATCRATLRRPNTQQPHTQFTSPPPPSSC